MYNPLPLHRRLVLVLLSCDDHPLHVDTLLPVALHHEHILPPAATPIAVLLHPVMAKSADGPRLLEEEAYQMYRELGLFKHGNSTGLYKTQTQEFQHSYP